jgi:hypothetical protein
MKMQNNLGVWMDHSIANLIDINATKKSHSISSKFTYEMKKEILSRSEKTMHNKRQQLQGEYYKQISETILKYDHVLLFGPTDAKIELHNFLNEDLHFKDVKIDVETADNMSDIEQASFVTKYFS